MNAKINRTGSRRPLPENALKVCASCLRPRGTVRRGWSPITKDGEVLGWTCPECPTHEEPIRRVGEGSSLRFVAVVDGTPGPEGERRQIKRTHTSLPAAREWVEETRKGVAVASRAGEGYDPDHLTVRVLCERWLAKRAKEVDKPGGIREVTLNGYASSLHALLLHMGDSVAHEVTPDDVEDALLTLATVGGKWRRGLSHRSIVYALTSLRQAYKHGMRAEWVTENPAALAKPPREQHGVERKSAALRWSPAQVVEFRNEADRYAAGERFAAEPWLQSGMRLTACGMRRSEVLGLDWLYVIREAGSVKVAASRVKTGRGRATALGEVKAANSLRTIQAEVIHPGTRAALRSLWLAQGQPESGLVIRNAVGEPVDPDTYSARFRAICRAACVPALTSIHNVRHSLATALKADGVPDHEAAALLGHDVDTYRRFYLVTDDEGAASAAEAAGRLFAR